MKNRTSAKTPEQSTAQKIINFAKSIGFDLVGFSHSNTPKAAYKHFLNWLKMEFEGEMSYISERKRVKKRTSAKKLLASASSVISLAVNYYHDQPPLSLSDDRIARYAFGRDYHKILKKKLQTLKEFLQKEFKAKTLSYVDTGPLLERAFAVQAGLGFIGKNSCLITKKFGSWVLLCEVITNLKLKNLKQKLSSTSNLSCGSCTKCIDSCPTKAIIKNKNGQYFIDSNRCLSYLTIEYKGSLSKLKKSSEIIRALNSSHRLFGCDICQEVCPHNCRAKISTHEEFTNPKIAGDSLDLKKILKIKSEKEFLSLFAGSSLMRAKLKGLKRTAKMLHT